MSDTTYIAPTYISRPTTRMEAIFLEAVERDDYENAFNWRHPESRPGAYVEHNFIVTDDDETEFATFSDEGMAAACMTMIQHALAQVTEIDRDTYMDNVRRYHGFRRVYDVARF